MKIIITESQRKRLFLNENEELLNKILDKIGEYGMESLTDNERMFLNNMSKGKVDSHIENLLSMDSGYEFDGVVDDIPVKFTYESTEEWDDNPKEYKHIGIFNFMNGSDEIDYYAEIYTDADYNFMHFDLHDGNDYVNLNEELEDDLTHFFLDVSNKLAESM
jgi:hypothetical protein